MKFSVYEIASGRVIRSGECPARMVEAQASDPSEAVLIGTALDDAEWMIEDGAAQPRPELSAPAWAVGVGEGWTIDAPAGARVYVRGERVGEADQAGATLVFEAAGSYPVEVRRAWPFRDFSAVVEVS